MKIKLSKSQWESIGKKAGWMKVAENNAEDDFGDISEHFFGDLLRNFYTHSKFYVGKTNPDDLTDEELMYVWKILIPGRDRWLSITYYHTPELESKLKSLSSDGVRKLLKRAMDVKTHYQKKYRVE